MMLRDNYMNTHPRYRISKLIVAYWSGTISRKEEEELSAWRDESEKNEKFFQRILEGERFAVYREQGKEHDFRVKFMQLEKKMKRDRRRLVLRRIRYVAVVLPFVLLTCWFLLKQDVIPGSAEVGQNQIVVGSSRAILTWGRERRFISSTTVFAVCWIQP